MKVRFEFYDVYGTRKSYYDDLNVLPCRGDMVRFQDDRSFFGFVTDVLWQLEDDYEKETNVVVKIKL